MPDRRSGSGLRSQRAPHFEQSAALATATEPLPAATLLGGARHTVISGGKGRRGPSKLRVAVDVDEGERGRRRSGARQQLLQRRAAAG